ncbi:MAG TPA: hypothetical protein VFB60_07720 [Ktedonobacteraceae bacterium]|nr:hypothetical protein [Ktedonobacteraceae bacterium]
MSNYDERLAALEDKVATIELQPLHLAQENTPVEQGRSLREANENITILLGIAVKQNERIKAVEDNLSRFREHVDQQFTEVKQDIAELNIKVDRLEQRFTSLEQRFVSLENKTEQRFIALENRMTSLETRFDALEGKFDQVLQMVTSLARAINN